MKQTPNQTRTCYDHLPDVTGYHSNFITFLFQTCYGNLLCEDDHICMKPLLYLQQWASNRYDFDVNQRPDVNVELLAVLKNICRLKVDKGSSYFKAGVNMNLSDVLRGLKKG